MLHSRAIEGYQQTLSNTILSENPQWFSGVPVPGQAHLNADSQKTEHSFMRSAPGLVLQQST